MKKFRFFKFTKSVQAIMLAMLMASFFSSCKDEDKPEPEPEKSGAKAMTNLIVTDADNTEFTAQLQSDNKTWQFMPSLNYDKAKLAKAKITFDVSVGATAEPAPGAEVDLSEPVDVTVTAEDETTIVYTIEMVEGTSSAKDIISFSVYLGDNYTGKIDNDKDIITVELPSEKWELRDEVVATFECSLGATSIPASPATLNFTEEVKIVVTAHDGSKRTYTVICVAPGFDNAEAGVYKTFPELGYPGYVGPVDGDPAIMYGDLLMYNAYCGDNIILFSRIYANLKVGDYDDANFIENYPDLNDEEWVSSIKSTCSVKVLDKNTLNDAGTLNLGSISLSDIKMLTSDYKGRCVAAVVNNGETEFFYWTNPTVSPISVGKININFAASAIPNFQVAGDITDNAWITAFAPPSADGEHYRVKVSGGQLEASHTIVKTGYASNDCSQFQMISSYDDSDSPDFVVGDTEGTVNTGNSVKCYWNNFAGGTYTSMPGFWQDKLQTWWVGTGMSTTRTGGRSPAVSALPINGKTYVAVASGSGFYHTAVVLNSDLQELAHENLNFAADVATSRAWSYGACIDWYSNEDLKEAYLAIWFGRLGLYTYKMTW